MIKYLLSFLLLTYLFISLDATERRPWFGPDKLPEFRLDYTYQHYSKIDSGGRDFSRHGDDHFINLSASITPGPPCNIELEALIDHTRKTHGFDCARITGRYLFLDDVIGDPMSLSAGITITRATHTSLHDISSFHHGLMEYEAHVAIGKECSCEGFWSSRIWGFMSLAIADRGSPWMRAYLGYERNCWDWHDYGIFIRSLWGFGKHNIRLTQRFPGYGSISHGSIELGAYYRKFFECFGGYVHGQYVYRLWAHNFPTDTHLLTVGILFPFSPF